MKDLAIRVRLNRLVNWYRVEGDRIQIVAPDGNCITISNAAEYAPILGGLSTGVELMSIGDDADELIQLLHSMGCLLDDTEEHIGSYFEQYAQFCSKLTNSKHPHPIAPPQSIKVTGEGCLALAAGSRHTEDVEITDDTLVVALSDWEDRDFFDDQYRAALKVGCSILSVRWVENRLFVGPLIIRGEGPCYDCYFHRAVASTSHVPEFHAQTSQMPTSTVERLDDKVIRSFVDYVIERQIALIMAGAFDQAAYASVERWDPYTGQVDRGVLHKIPYCGSCGGAKVDDPVAAVRDLI